MADVELSVDLDVGLDVEGWHEVGIVDVDIDDEIRGER